MNRRNFLATGLAALALACVPGAAAAAPFQPTRFSVQVTGQGPDVVLIPGLSSGRDVWAPTVRAVPGYRYHLVQVGGFAGEPVRGNASGPVVAPLADEIARYIVDRGLRSPAIVGHSMGGTLAMMIGARHPAAAGKIMVVDMLPQPAGLFGASEASPLARSLRNMIATPDGQRLVGSLLSAFSPPDSAAGRSNSDVVGRAMHDLAGIDLTPQLARIEAPMTVVYASPTPEGRAAIDRQFAAAYRSTQAKLVRIDGAGHMVMLDEPARFRAVLGDFLAD